MSRDQFLGLTKLLRFPSPACAVLLFSSAVILLLSIHHSCGAVDGCLTPILTPSGEHKEEFTDRKSQCSLLIIPIVDTRRFRYFVGGFPGSRGDSLAFRSRSWYTTAEDPLLRRSLLSIDEFILGDAGFALSKFLVRSCVFPGSYGSVLGGRGGEQTRLILGVHRALEHET